uniref:Uncharacterized protein n=1 Tax=virus sp. ctBM815 TaxID=2825806 RepID=A0A8S5RKZ7_9VIRU|nr:MAG TPA: hypothetical protein [virus sp. ctBM815]
MLQIRVLRYSRRRQRKRLLIEFRVIGLLVRRLIRRKKSLRKEIMYFSRTLIQRSRRE